ncbi:MAG: NADH-quinone oxidoreductase subunit NuoF [candidate division KSB1 bacterium]|nr:NADH-quinone oxidoreductase subunit NuoF [candidate division KSB1 bacterium]
MAQVKIITELFEVEGSHRLDVYERHGGYQAIRKVLADYSPEAVIEEVKRSRLRGLGGAGFPTGLKWSFVPKQTTKPKYVVVNADEGEPGTFKDRYIMMNVPHNLLEGIMIAAYAIGAHTAFIYLRGEYVRPRRRLEQAIAEAYAKGYLGESIFGSGYRLDVWLHLGAGAYICGEETALLESLEGKKGWPRLKPPFPASVGAFGCPTIVNNVETLSYVPHIIRRGAEWFASLGTERSGGARILSISGHVQRPGIYEVSMDTTLREAIFDCAGGIREGRSLKAVIPGGSSSPVLRANEIDVPCCFDALAAAGSMAGSGAVIVMDDTTCMFDALRNIVHFYAHESCGQCTPCRVGTGWLRRIMDRIAEGRGMPGDVDNLYSIAADMLGRTICPLGDAAAMPVMSFVEKFRDEFEEHVRHGGCDLQAVRPVRAS